MQSTLIVVTGIVVALYGLMQLGGAFGGDAGLFSRAGMLLLAAVTIAAGVGFAMRQGWAFTLVSVGLLIQFLIVSVDFVVAFDSDAAGSVKSASIPLLINMAAIGYFGRWELERHFRPHEEHH